MKRREQALEKIRRLERKLDLGPSDREGVRIEREITRLQIKYSITLEEIEGPKDYTKMFPFLPDSVIKLMEKGDLDSGRRTK